MIKNNNDFISFEIAAERLTYNPESGELRWRPKVSGPDAKRWNKLFAGKTLTRIDNRGYIRVHMNGMSFAAHRVAWLLHYGKLPTEEIDHINGIKHDNRICNLREADRALNLDNRRGYSASGIPGVSQCGDRWRAWIGLSGRRTKHLGTFATKEQASEAQQRAMEQRRMGVLR